VQQNGPRTNEHQPHTNIQFHHAQRRAQSGRKVGRQMFRYHARLISDVPSTMPRPTKESEALVAAPVPVNSCLGLWRYAGNADADWLALIVPWFAKLLPVPMPPFHPICPAPWMVVPRKKSIRI